MWKKKTCRRVASLHDVELYVVLLGQRLQCLSVAGMQLGDDLLLARNQGLQAGGTHREDKGNKPLCRMAVVGLRVLRATLQTVVKRLLAYVQ